MSDFSSIQTALSGLVAHRRALEVIGHNVANAATEGYSRRRVDLQAIAAGVIPALHSVSDRVGGGVEVAGISRIRDQFLEERFLAERASTSSLDALARTLGRVEMVFPEPSETGIARQLADLWGAFEDVANLPQSLAARSALLEQAASLVESLRRSASELTATRDAAFEQIQAIVAEANAGAVRVAELNGAIRAAEAAGLSPGDLLDERDLLLEKLAELVGVTVRPGELGTVDVFVGGSTLVRGERAEALEVQEGPEPALVGVDLKVVSLQWSNGGHPATVTSGGLGGLLQGVNVVAPRYVAATDGVAARLVEAVNDLHAQGQNLAGDPVPPAIAFFDPDGTTAATIRLSDDVANRPEQVAAAVAGGGTLDGSIAQAIAALGELADGPDATYMELIGALGVESQAAARRVDVQRAVMVQVDRARLEVRGVDIDEEIAMLVTMQHAYAASARVLTAVDEMLATLIGRTGVVGR